MTISEKWSNFNPVRASSFLLHSSERQSDTLLRSVEILSYFQLTGRDALSLEDCQSNHILAAAAEILLSLLGRQEQPYPPTTAYTNLDSISVP